jgi:hypothetical protein
MNDDDDWRRIDRVVEAEAAEIVGLPARLARDRIRQHGLTIRFFTRSDPISDEYIFGRITAEIDSGIVKRATAG